MFITDFLRQPLTTARLDEGFRLAPDSSAGELENLNAPEQPNIPLVQSVKEALEWLASQERGAAVTEFRRHLQSGPDSHFGLLQTAQFILRNVVVVGVVCPSNRLLAEIEYSNAGERLPDVSPPPSLSEDGKITLSRFCYLHREDDRLLLTMPLKDKRFVIRDRAVGSLLFELGFGADLRRIESACGGDEDLFAGFRCLLNILYHDEFIIPVANDSPRLPTRLEEGDSAMQQWDFHDLVAHANSRFGYNYGANFGGAFPFIHLIDPQPAVRPLPQGERIALHKPDLQRLADNDKRLTELVIQRLSVRAYDEEAPISLQQIGEFFFRSGRVLYENTTVVTGAQDPAKQTDMELAWRPYPTGGASYELEFYLTVDRADGLDPGIYYYSPGTHELIKLSGKSGHTEGLIQAAYISCAQIVRPQTLIHIAARFQRVSWKYHNIAYSTMLRNTGVVYQTFYLNAIAMGLAGCGLGSGYTELFCRATGNAPHVECNIGEFMLGSLPKAFNYDTLDMSASAAIHNSKLSPTAY